MDTEQAFLEAALPEPVTLLHQNLLPYCLGHQIILERQQSPFVVSTEEGIPKTLDLMIGVLVCSSTYDEAMVELRKPQAEFAERIEAWLKLCGKMSELQVLECMVEFQKYIAAGSRQPKFRKIHRPGRTSRTPGAPMMCVYLSFLLEHGLTRTEALNCPYGLAKWLFAAHYERKGEISIASTGDEENIALIREAAAKEGWRLVKAAPGCQVVTAKMAKAMEVASATAKAADGRPSGPSLPGGGS